MQQYPNSQQDGTQSYAAQGVAPSYFQQAAAPNVQPFQAYPTVAAPAVAQQQPLTLSRADLDYIIRGLATMVVDLARGRAPTRELASLLGAVLGGARVAAPAAFNLRAHWRPSEFGFLADPTILSAPSLQIRESATTCGTAWVYSGAFLLSSSSTLTVRDFG